MTSTLSGGAPMMRWNALAAFLALLLVTYQLPDVRITILGVPLPLAAIAFIPVFVTVLASVGKAKVDRIFMFGVIVLMTAIIVSAIGSAALPEEVFKGAFYPLTALALAAYLGGSSERRTSFVVAFCGGALVVTLYGIALFLLGQGEGSLFYIGLHYTEATRNADGLFFAAAALMAAAAYTRGQPRIVRAILVVTWIVCSAAAFLTFARSAWVAALVASVVLFAAQPSRRVLLVALVGSIIVSAGVAAAVDQDLLTAAGTRAETLLGVGDSSNLERVALADAALEALAESPLKGVGPGQFSATLGYSQLSPFRHAENGYLTFAAESGLLAAAAFMVINGRALWNGITSRRAGKLLVLTLGVFMAVEFLFVSETRSLMAWSLLGLIHSD